MLLIVINDLDQQKKEKAEKRNNCPFLIIFFAFPLTSLNCHLRWAQFSLNSRSNHRRWLLLRRLLYLCYAAVSEADMITDRINNFFSVTAKRCPVHLSRNGMVERYHRNVTDLFCIFWSYTYLHFADCERVLHLCKFAELDKRYTQLCMFSRVGQIFRRGNSR